MKLLEKATSCFQNQLPFVLYAKPNEENLFGVFQNDDVLHVFDNQKGFVFASFYSETHVVFPLSNSESGKEEIYFEIQDDFASTDSKKEENAKNSFENLVRNGVAEIEKGSFEKVVLSRKIEVSQSINVINSYQKLLKKYPTAFRYLWFHPKVGMWMGATPEQLAKIKDNTFETVALAGTQVYAENITWQEKEIVEQHLVVNYIKSRVEDLVETLQISEAYTQKAGNIVHLKSDISGKLKQNISEMDVIKAIHPTSAVCGMPLESARNFILEKENYNRKYYAGFLGEFQMQEQTNLFVNLRCCEFVNYNTNFNLKNQSEVEIYVGCGITKDSNPEKEFIETENKSKTILSILAKSN